MHPVLFQIGRFPVHSYGVMVLAGFLLGLWFATNAAKKRQNLARTDGKNPVSPDNVFDMAIVALFVAIAGARLLYVLLNLSQFRGQWVSMLQIWQGGLSIHGAIIAGILYLAWYCRRHKLSFLEFADICAPGFALGYAIGRIGCFLNGCCYGAACSLPWAVRFMDEHAPGTLTPPSHPTQIYASLMNLAWFGLLAAWLGRKHKNGEVFLGYLALYCIYRFIDEQFRKGATAEVLAAGLTHAQVFSLVALPVILFFLYRVRTAAAASSAVPQGPANVTGRG